LNEYFVPVKSSRPGGKGLRKRFDRGRGGWGKELMIRATWRKGWVSIDEKGLTFKRMHNIRLLTELLFIDGIGT
jgi:sorbitol-specific phosphotransferase system component IIBC